MTNAAPAEYFKGRETENFRILFASALGAVIELPLQSSEENNWVMVFKII